MMKHFRLLMVFISMMLSCKDSPSMITDIEGNTYLAINYKGTLWMTENLRVQKDTNGNMVKYYLPGGDTENTTIYGLLYDYETACKICPEGWELPTNEDWKTLFPLENNQSAIQFKDTNYWKETVNTNTSKFSARPAGFGNHGEHDNAFGEKTLFWSKDGDSEFGWTYILEKGKNTIRKAEQHSTYAFSVRCIKRVLK